MRTTSVTALNKLVIPTTDKEVFNLSLSRKGYSKDVIETLWKYYFLINLTDYFPIELRDYFINGDSAKEICERYNIRMSTFKSKLYRSTTKLVEEIGFDYWDEIDNGKAPKSITKEANTKVDQIISKTNKTIDAVSDVFIINIKEKMDNSLNFMDIDGDQFLKVIESYKLICVPYLTSRFEGLDKRLAAYGVYLLSTPDEYLPELEKLRKNKMLEELNIPESARI